MTKIVFETATLADAIKKANTISPSRGQAFDAAAGLVMEVNPAPMPVVIRATNLEVFSMEWVDMLEVEGEPTKWRIPSQIFNQVVSSLPIGTGKTVTLEEKIQGFSAQLHLTSGRTKARFNLLDLKAYPSWGAFDPDELSVVRDFGGLVALVSHAVSRDTIPMTGVHLDGELAIATDRYRLAAVPLPMVLNEPVTVPANLLSQVLRQTGEISVGREDNQLLIMPDEHSQIRTVIYAEAFPGVKRIMSTDFEQSITVRKDAILDILNRAANFDTSNRVPSMKLFIGKEEIAVMMNNEEMGLLGDVLEVPGQCLHDRITLTFTPKNLIEAISNAPNDQIEFSYSPSSLRVVYIDGGSGYQSWVMPRKENAVSEEAS